MPSSYLKDIFREIKISLGRFLSILCIVAIGVAFFSGIKASAPDMKNSADMYFDTYNVQDIQIYSTLGLTKKDPIVSTPEARTPQYYAKRPCSMMVESAARIFGDYLVKEGKLC